MKKKQATKKEPVEFCPLKRQRTVRDANGNEIPEMLKDEHKPLLRCMYWNPTKVQCDRTLKGGCTFWTKEAWEAFQISKSFDKGKASFVEVDLISGKKCEVKKK